MQKKGAFGRLFFSSKKVKLHHKVKGRLSPKLIPSTISALDYVISKNSNNKIQTKKTDSLINKI
jgi:hypothetical protein